MQEEIDVSQNFFEDIQEAPQDQAHKTFFQENFSPKQIGSIAKYIEPVSANVSAEYLSSLFKDDEELRAIPIEQNDSVIGIVERRAILEATNTTWKRLTSKNIIDYVEPFHESLNANDYIEKTLGEISKINRQTGSVFFPVYSRRRFLGLVSLDGFLDKMDQLRAQDLAKAAAIQKSFMPSSDTKFGSCELRSWNKMANELGGDIYQAIKLDDTKSMICCFDVSGKNVAASLLTIAVGSFFKMIRVLPKDALQPEKIISMLDEFLQDSVPMGNFITAAICCFDEEKRRISIYNCGHTNVYAIIKNESGANGKMAVIEPTFPPMGMGAVSEQIKNSKDGKNGATVLPFKDCLHINLYSDGFTDMKNNDGERYEDDRAKDFFINLYRVKDGDVEEKIQGEVTEWIQNAMLPDDVTVLDLRLKSIA